MRIVDSSAEGSVMRDFILFSECGLRVSSSSVDYPCFGKPRTLPFVLAKPVLPFVVDLQAVTPLEYLE